MGYYTHFELNTKDGLGSQTAGKLKKELERMDVFEDIDSGPEARMTTNGRPEKTDRLLVFAYAYAKWYDADEDMLLLSTRFPGVVFSLRGYGEESEDIWEHYYLDGCMQDANVRLVQDDFDPAALLPAEIRMNKYSYET